MTMAKAIVAGLMASLFLINHFIGIDFGLDEKTVTSGVDVVIAIVGTAGTWFVSNKTQ